MPLNNQQRDAHRGMTDDQLEYVIVNEMITISPEVDVESATEILKIYSRKVIERYELNEGPDAT